MPKRDHYKRTEASISSRRKNIVSSDQIVSGGLPPDGIPSIDKPKFISVQEADKMLQDSELVVGTYLQISDIFPHFIKVAYSSCLFFSVNSLYWAKR